MNDQSVVVTKPSFFRTATFLPTSAVPEEPSQLRLLVVDDVALCRKFHKQLLGPFCKEIVEAANGLEAINRVVEAMKQGVVFDGIIMDNSMPVLCGTAAARSIRELGYSGRIFGVTGNGFQSDIDEFLSNGADEVLVKPLGMEGYAHVIAALQKG
jgi:CheY-like chemotaxis protein